MLHASMVVQFTSFESSPRSHLRASDRVQIRARSLTHSLTRQGRSFRLFRSFCGRAFFVVFVSKFFSVTRQMVVRSKEKLAAGLDPSLFQSNSSILRDELDHRATAPYLKTESLARFLENFLYFFAYWIKPGTGLVIKKELTMPVVP